MILHLLNWKKQYWMHPKKYRDTSQQDILFFFACYYYMGYCRLPVRQDYRVQRKPNSCLPAHWVDGQFSCCDKFDYVWRNISLDLLLIDKEFDNTVGVNGDGQFKPEEVTEEFIVKTVQEDEDNNDDGADHDDNDDDDNESKIDDKQNNYCDDKEPAPEEEDDNEMSKDNDDDDSVDDETINEQDDDDKVKQEKRHYKEKFMLDWVNKSLCTHCIHPGFAVSLDKMMKLFKGCLNMAYRMKKNQLKKVSSFMQWSVP